MTTTGTTRSSVRSATGLLKMLSVPTDSWEGVLTEISHEQKDGAMWCLPNLMLVPEMCGSPLFMIVLGGEIWLFLLSLHALPVIVLGSVLFND